MPLAIQPTLLDQDDTYYPDSDGKPMADNDTQRKPLTYLVEALDYHFKEQSDVYVSADLLIYYERKKPKVSVAPDVLVVFGVAKHERGSYKIWLEGKAPDVVVEIASPSTFRKDEIVKSPLYQRLGIQEYFQYDPTGDYMQPRLRGRSLDKDGQYQDMPIKQLKNGQLILTSLCLKLEMHLKDERLRVFNPVTKDYLQTYAEAVDASNLAEKQAQQERKLKEWAQQDAKIKEQQREQAQQQAEQERQQKESAQQQAEQERQQKELAQQQVVKLAEQLRILGINPNLNNN